MQNKLKPCPFCGGEAEIKTNHVYTEKGFCVHCKTHGCNAHTMTVLYECTYNQYEGKRDVYVTKEMAEERVTKMWNRRIDNVATDNSVKIMTNSERLTKRWGNNCVATKLNYDFLLSLPNIEVKNFNAIIQKLAYYEDLKEQARLIVPPCKVGTEIFGLFDNDDEQRKEIYEGKVLCYSLDENNLLWARMRYKNGLTYWHTIDDFSKTVFLTREEAEKALVERGRSNDS